MKSHCLCHVFWVCLHNISHMTNCGFPSNLWDCIKSAGILKGILNKITKSYDIFSYRSNTTFAGNCRILLCWKICIAIWNYSFGLMKIYCTKNFEKIYKSAATVYWIVSKSTFRTLYSPQKVEDITHIGGTTCMW